MKPLAVSLLLAAALLGENAGSAPSDAAPRRAPGTVFRECPDCPEMVVIPAGQFSMGSSPADQPDYRDLIMGFRVARSLP